MFKFVEDYIEIPKNAEYLGSDEGHSYFDCNGTRYIRDNVNNCNLVEVEFYGPWPNWVEICRWIASERK
jgi:hypothetical protein